MFFIKQRFIRAILSASVVSVLTQLLAVSRQVLIASRFGVSRELDVFLVSYAVVLLLVISVGTIFESASVQFLIQAREESGGERVGLLGVSCFKASLLLGVAVALLLQFLTPLLAPVMAAGFSDAELALLEEYAAWYLPVVPALLPYSVLAAIHKSRWRFARVFVADALVMALSVGSLWFFGSAPHILPIAFFIGYIPGCFVLLPGAGIASHWRQGRLRDSFQVVSYATQVFVANQAGTLGSLIDRFFQSLVLPGGISAFNYVAQLINGMAGFLSFREVFFVPLSEQEDRSKKLERLLSALLLVTVPCVGLLELLARDVVSLLFERGRFDRNAAELTVRAFVLYSPTLVLGSLTAPLLRIFQIAQRTRLTYVYYFLSSGFLLVFGWLFIYWLRLDVEGVALMLLFNSGATLAAAALLVFQCDIQICWVIVARYFALALIATGGAGLGAYMLVYNLQGLMRVGVALCVYFLLLSIAYLVKKTMIRELLS